jgi:Leucine-rich repeat (LRR) protein
MEGLIPDSFFGLTNLVVLGLDDNFLESDISQFAKLNNMQKLYIEGKSVHKLLSCVGLS